MHKQAITFDDVLLIPGYNHCDSRRDVSTENIDLTGKLSLDIPIMSANMDTITEEHMAGYMAEQGGMGVLHRFMSIEDNVAMFKKSPKKTFVSIGASDAEFERFMALREAGAEYFCLDVAHGHAKYVGGMLKKVKAVDKNICVMAGNVATYAGADYLANCGADIIKVGIGPGSVCSTRIKTGFGVPQLTAIMECAQVSRSIVADGGIRFPGDFVKALAFGADFVMIGGMLSGSYYTPAVQKFLQENPDQEQRLIDQGVVYRGMASKEVADDYHNGLTAWKTSGGVAVNVPYKDKQATDFVLHDLIGGLRSGMTYSGAKNIKELQKKNDYHLITSSGMNESHPHKQNG